MARAGRRTASERRKTAVQEAPAPVPEDPRPTIAPTIHFLDMGRERYGDCILIRSGDVTVLVDGGHPGDFDGQPGYASIPEQLRGLLGPPPFTVTLLVVTHAHNDHIGCLPRMVEADMIRPTFALVADPDLGFPPSADETEHGVAHSDALQGAIREAVAGLREEDPSGLDDAELRLFLDSLTRLGDRYRAMLATLSDRGCSVFRWGKDDPAQLAPFYAAMAGSGFDVVGPTVGHLRVCRDQIVAAGRDAASFLRDGPFLDRADHLDPDPMLAVDLYRAAYVSNISDAASHIDWASPGAALNCQSIVFVCGPVGNKALFVGDMQFAEPGVPGLSPFMAELQERVRQEGPYRLLKTPHHTSRNGLDADFWAALGRPSLVVHSGGAADPKHPEREALQDLADWAPYVFARTDRNGQITLDLSQPDAGAIKLARGEANIYEANAVPPSRRDREPGSVAEFSKGSPTRPKVQDQEWEAHSSMASDGKDKSIDIVLLRIPFEDVRLEVDGHTIVVERRAKAMPPPEPPSPSPPADATPKLGDGRDLSNLVFVSNQRLLEARLGEAASRAFGMIRDGGAELVLTDGATEPGRAVREVLARGGKKGVVLVGGYDVIPSQRVDVLGPALRAAIPREAIRKDPDEFVVWSDDVWGDADGSGLADLPVSRIPDGGQASLLMRALSASHRWRRDRFGVRNVARPFASAVYAALPGKDGLLESAPTAAVDVPVDAMSRSHIYLMLHGHDADATKFWGDDQINRTVIEAVDAARLPRDDVGVVFAGCCWGALIVNERANAGARSVTPRAPEDSIALSFLAAGAVAFVGCTGVHYSPDSSGSFFGGPMHVAFWRELLANGGSPAEALFEARKSFLAGIPHGRRTDLELGIERKIYRQFTCLGLGW